MRVANCGYMGIFPTGSAFEVASYYDTVSFVVSVMVFGDCFSVFLAVCVNPRSILALKSNNWHCFTSLCIGTKKLDQSM